MTDGVIHWNMHTCLDFTHVSSIMGFTECKRHKMSHTDALNTVFKDLKNYFPKLYLNLSHTI